MLFSNHSSNHFISRIFFSGIICFLCFATWVYGQASLDTTAYRVYPLRIEHDFKISGHLTNPVWKRAETIYISHQFMPNDQEPAPVQTKVKVLYSDSYLYIGFWAYDSHPSKIRARISDRDQINSDDQVGVILDPFNSNQHAVQLFANPRGIQLDVKRVRGDKNINFDMLWYSKGAITDFGYTVAMKIPFDNLHFPGNSDTQNWSVNFIRKYPRNKHYEMAWTNFTMANPCVLCQSGGLMGMTEIENSSSVSIIPYALGYKSSVLNDPGDPVSGLDSRPVDGRIGATILYSPTSTSTINLTINPDFSQVETDAAKIGVNKTFALRYSEKRPFFLKKSSAFHTGNNLFYSRTINRPLVAAKYTKTARNYSIAFLSAYDRNTPFIVPGLFSSNTIKSDINAYDNILRGKVNIGSQSYIGGLLTTRNVSDGHNYVGSIDWDFFLGGNYYFSGTAAYSSTKELGNTKLFNDPRQFGQSRYDAAFNGEEYNGSFLDLQFERQAKYYDFSIGYKSLSPTFQAQNGFITQIDRRLLRISQDVTYFPSKWWLSKGGLRVHATWRYDFGYIFKERRISVNWFNYFAGQTRLSIWYLLLKDETFRSRFFTDLHHISFNLHSSPAKFFSFGVNLKTGRFIYRTLHPEPGQGYNFSASTTIKPIPRLKLHLQYSYSTLSSLDDSKTFYSGSISRLEGHFSFNRHLFFRLITQYNSFNEQIQIYPLLYYKVNPFTKIYLGMTDNIKHVNRIGPPRINEYRSINRKFFIKIQYLIRK